MNFIFIMLDSLRRDHLGCYGNRWISTPNLDRLARQSVIFDRAYASSHPTVPNRTDLLTGRYSFPFKRWSPLTEEETSVAETLSRNGFVTQLVTDNYHLVSEGYNLQRGFTGWSCIRGQEADNHKTGPLLAKFPCNPAKLRQPYEYVAQYLRNVAERRSEEDYFAPQLFRSAAKWLEQNYKRTPFLLWVDSFDPHEPFDPPRYYADMYYPNYKGQEVIYPRYGKADYLTPSELKRVKALYAGEVTMADRWAGHFLQRVEDMGLLDSTVIIFTSDHGYYLGEHGLIGKPWLARYGREASGLYEEKIREPLLIRFPKGKWANRRVGALVQPVDMAPTILDLGGVKAGAELHGESMMKLLRGQQRTLRPFAMSGRFGEGITASTARWSLLCWPAGEYSELYDLSADPGQERNVLKKECKTAGRLHKKLIRALESIGMPPERLELFRRAEI